MRTLFVTQRLQMHALVDNDSIRGKSSLVLRNALYHISHRKLASLAYSSLF